MKGDGRTLDGFNRRPDQRNRRYGCDSEYHLAPKCPYRDTPRREGSPFSQVRDRAHIPLYSPVSTETRVSAQKVDHLEESGTDAICEQYFSTTIDLGE